MYVLIMVVVSGQISTAALSGFASNQMCQRFGLDWTLAIKETATKRPTIVTKFYCVKLEDTQ